MTYQFPDTSNYAPYATLRDYFASHAMMGLLASNAEVAEDLPTDSVIAIAAYAVADAMLEARRK